MVTSRFIKTRKLKNCRECEWALRLSAREEQSSKEKQERRISKGNRKTWWMLKGNEWYPIIIAHCFNHSTLRII
jgi:Fe-S-cluster-containing hydrogenase component 2